MAKRRVRSGKVQVYVPSHSWKLGKARTHPGYWRNKRKPGKKLIVGKSYKLYEVRDENGNFRGWKKVKR